MKGDKCNINRQIICEEQYCSDCSHYKPYEIQVVEIIDFNGNHTKLIPDYQPTEEDYLQQEKLA